MRILALQGRGLGVMAIADRLGMTDATVRRYVRQANGYQAKQWEPGGVCLARGDSGRQQKSYASAVSTCLEFQQSDPRMIPRV